MEIKKLEQVPFLLTNSGELSLFFVGVGSAFSKRHYQTNLLIIKGEDHLMIDCGSKTPQAFYELGIPLTKVRNFLITHSHADHIGGLEEIMLTNRYVTKTKPVMVINDIYQEILWNHSLKGGSGFNEEESGKRLEFGDLWTLIRPNWLPNYPRETLEANLGSINLKMFRTMHIPDSTIDWHSAFWSCGLIIDNKIMFTSDTKYDQPLIESFTDIFELETIFHDCQFYKGGVHASLDELNQLSPDVKAKMILMHYGDNWDQFESKIKEYGFQGLAKQWYFYNYK